MLIPLSDDSMTRSDLLHLLFAGSQLMRLGVTGRMRSLRCDQLVTLGSTEQDGIPNEFGIDREWLLAVKGTWGEHLL